MVPVEEDQKISASRVGPMGILDEAFGDQDDEWSL